MPLRASEPALKELLPRSGIPTDVGTIGYYNGLLLALFLVGWGLSMLWGPIGEPLRACTHADLHDYLLFSFHLSAGARRPERLAILRIFRLLAGIGIGGEWTLGENVRRGGVAARRSAAQDGRGLHADRLLSRNFDRGPSPTRRWEQRMDGALCSPSAASPAAFLVVLIQFGVHEPDRWKPPLPRGVPWR